MSLVLYTLDYIKKKSWCAGLRAGVGIRFVAEDVGELLELVEIVQLMFIMLLKLYM